MSTSGVPNPQPAPATTGPAPVPLAPTAPAHDILPTLFGDGYGIYQVRRGSFVIGFLLEILFVVVTVWIGTWTWEHRAQVKEMVNNTVIDISPYVLPVSKDAAGGGGGGGDRDKLEASKGALPKTSMNQFTPPAAVIRNNDPKLPVAPTVLVPPQIKLPTGEQMGDPLSKILGPASNGTGSGSGIGTGSGGGVGSGTGAGVGPGFGGGIGGGIFRVGGGVSAPKAIYAPDPEYSEEARKAKWQGTVVLWVVVGADGRPHDIKVQRSLGMGLDQKAIEAVKQWRFEPARKDGQPVAVQINVEVNFRLY